MNSGEIELAARRMLNAVGSTFWSEAEVFNYTYMAAMELATNTYCIEKRINTTIVANQQEYDLVDKALAIKRVEYDSQKLMPIDFQKLDSIDLNTNTTVTGEPQYYYYFADAIGLFPVPTDNTKILKVFYYSAPTVITQAAQEVEVPLEYHHHLVIGTAFYMTMKELGHPHLPMYERLWNSPGNPNSCINQVRRAVKMRNKDSMPVVKREEDLPGTLLGAI
jgi:hypothetical protein